MIEFPKYKLKLFDDKNEQIYENETNNPFILLNELAIQTFEVPSIKEPEKVAFRHSNCRYYLKSLMNYGGKITMELEKSK